MRPIIFTLIGVICVLLSGCGPVGALGGGISYDITYTGVEGQSLRAKINSVQNIENVELSLLKDDSGKPIGITFKKSGAQSGTWSNTAISDLTAASKDIAATAKSLATKVP